MTRCLVVLADGFEEIEAVTVIDVLRRAALSVVVAGLDRAQACGSHGIAVRCEVVLDEVGAEDFDLLVLPGGMPGSAVLRDDARVQALIRRFANDGKHLAAICAAPMALEAAGVLAGRRATSYPGVELPSARHVEDRVVSDAGVTTSRGAGSALEFALELVRLFCGEERAEALGCAMVARL